MCTRGDHVHRPAEGGIGNRAACSADCRPCGMPWGGEPKGAMNPVNPPRNLTSVFGAGVPNPFPRKAKLATCSAGSATCASTLHPETGQHCSMGEGVSSSPGRQQSEVKYRGWWILFLSMFAGVGSRLRAIGPCFSPAAVVPGSREVQAQATHGAASWHAWQRLQPLASTASAAGGSSARLRRVCRGTASAEACSRRTAHQRACGRSRQSSRRHVQIPSGKAWTQGRL